MIGFSSKSNQISANAPKLFIPPYFGAEKTVNNLPVGKYSLNLFHDNELAYQNACQLKALNIHAKADNTTLKFIIDQANTSFTLVIKDAFSRNIISELRSQELLNRRLQQNQGLNV